MNNNTAGKKMLSIVLLIAGIIALGAAIVLDIQGSKFAFRGALLIIGAIVILIGMYEFPTIEHHRSIINFIFLFPLLFTFAITVIVPMILGIFYSFTDWNGVKMNNFVGLKNYQTMFKDPAFLWSLLLTVLFVIVNMILVNVIGFLLALLCTNKFKGVGFFRAAYFLPNLIGGIVLGYIWQFIFSNVLIKMFHLKFSPLADTRQAFIAIIVVYIWQYAGYIMLIYITGLTTIPKDVLEAASIDGANATTTLFKIKIPMIAATITICTFLTLTSAFKQFDVNMALTNGAGAMKFMGRTISNGTQMLALNIYNTAISQNNYALGQAKAVLFFIILATVSIIQVRISNSKEVEM
ncbi:MAG: sugar ABC transporter permease [Lachnospiraceae bacterium]|nr:sugar ABC transporter permease [Lachnospiraceae bacterium]